MNATRATVADELIDLADRMIQAAESLERIREPEPTAADRARELRGAARQVESWAIALQEAHERANRIVPLFAAGEYAMNDGTRVQTQYCNTDDRLQRVKACTDPGQLREALDLDGLQSTVRVAIERRLRKLEAGR